MSSEWFLLLSQQSILLHILRSHSRSGILAFRTRRTCLWSFGPWTFRWIIITWSSYCLVDQLLCMNKIKRKNNKNNNSGVSLEPKLLSALPTQTWDGLNVYVIVQNSVFLCNFHLTPSDQRNTPLFRMNS
jgi:hypothetical protein